MSTKKELTFITGCFAGMSPVEEMKSVDGRAPKKRSVVTITTEDQQKAFFEVRDAVIFRIERLGLVPGDIVRAGFVFIGSEKNNKIYNNLFINHIDYAN